MPERRCLHRDGQRQEGAAGLPLVGGNYARSCGSRATTDSGSVCCWATSCRCCRGSASGLQHIWRTVPARDEVSVAGKILTCRAWLQRLADGAAVPRDQGLAAGDDLVRRCCETPAPPCTQDGAVLSLTDPRQNSLRPILCIFGYLVRTARQVGAAACALEPATRHGVRRPFALEHGLPAWQDGPALASDCDFFAQCEPPIELAQRVARYPLAAASSAATAAMVRLSTGRRKLAPAPRNWRACSSALATSDSLGAALWMRIPPPVAKGGLVFSPSLAIWGCRKDVM
jgi:hypothetical protein